MVSFPDANSGFSLSMNPEEDCLDPESSPTDDSSRCLSVWLLTGEPKDSCEPVLSGEEVDRNEGVPAETLDISDAESYFAGILLVFFCVLHECVIFLQNEVS